MFSGGDSSGEGISSINQLNSFGLGMAGMATNIDWASLAQEWIKMRDNNVMPEAPPPPNISGNYFGPSASNDLNITQPKKHTFDEKGEADMEMDDDEEKTERYGRVSNPNAQHITFPAETIIPQNSNWLLQEKPQLTNIMPPVNLLDDAHQKTAPTPWNSVWPPRVTLAPSVLHVPGAANPTAHIPSLMKMNLPHPNIDKSQIANNVDVTQNVPPMDAAKRKILPAWLREGLEKMEREKLKQLEKQQDGLNDDHIGLDVANAVDYKTDSTKNEYMVKNNLESLVASDSSGNEDNDNDDFKNIDGQRIEDSLTADNEISFKRKVAVRSDDSENDSDEEKFLVGKSYEQKLADLMVIVRRTLTELLLEVTNEEIAKIAHETIKTQQTKASSVQVIRKNALSSITGKLGLAAYADSDSEESGTDNERTDDTDKNNDTDEELRTSARAKRRVFAKTAAEIEEKILESAKREEENLKYYNQLEQDRQQMQQTHKRSNSFEDDATGSAGGSGGGISYERHFGEATETMFNQQLNGKRQRERPTRRGERTTRFSDNKDSKSQSMVAAATFMSQINSKASNNTVKPIGASVVNAIHTHNHPSSINIITPDPNGLLTAQMANSVALSAAEAVLERATKSSTLKASPTSRHHQRRHHSSRHSTDGSNSDTDDTHSSSSSRHSKYSYASSSKDKYSRHHSYTKKSHRERDRDRERERERDRDKDRDRSSHRRHRRDSSNSDDDRAYEHRSSSHRRRHHYRSRH